MTGLSPHLILLAAAAAALPDVAAAETRAELFPLERVALLDGPFRHSQELNRAYLLDHDVDRLLAPFRIEAGLEPRAPKYPNWESSGLEGHTAGHYLTALAQEWATSRDPEWRRRLDAMVAGLAECQAAGGDGYVGGIPRGRVLWRDLAAGRVNFQNFSLNDAWVPWYNLHKLFAGLRDAWLLANHAPARDVLVRLADWCDALCAGLDDTAMQAMLQTEHGGMNEVLADVFAITGDPKYLRLAQRFSHRAILDPLLRREDRLTGLHANTQIPKVIGFARVAELGGDPAWREAARFFWDTVVDRRSVAFGGNSEREHFNPPDDFSVLLGSREGPETCNTYNMLRLTEALFRAEPSARLADYYERAHLNHILGSQHPGHGGYVYFTPLRPRHYRVYSQPGVCFWCCVGSGMENHGKHGQFVFAREADDSALHVNLFIAAVLDWRERGVRVRQETRFPDESRTRLVLSVREPARFALKIRHPAWVAADGFVVRINGKTVAMKSIPASYPTLVREWRDGDTVEVDLPMRTTLERLPDGSDYAAILHGPVVLAAPTGPAPREGLVAGDGRMAHVSPGPYLPLDRAPMLVGEFDDLAAQVRPVPGKPLTFTAASAIRPAEFASLELVPFFRVHDARYMLYWRTVPAAEYPEVVATLEASERARLALEARTVDFVAPGEQQPEVEHDYRGEGSRTGVHHGRRWRDAAGWFSYRLGTGTGSGPLELILTYDAAERGRKFDLLVNDRVIATVALDGRERDRFIDVAYPLPPDVAAGGPLTVKLAAHPGSRTASLYALRLAKQSTRESREQP